MNFFFTQSPQIGAAKAYLLRQALSEVAKKANHTVVEQAKEADLVIVFGSSLPNSAELVGKKVFLANEDAAIASPEVTLTNALNQAVDYVQPTQSAVGFVGVSGVKISSRLQLAQRVLRIPLCLLKPLKPMQKNKGGR